EDVRLAVVKTFTPTTVTAGTGPHTFTIGVTNSGVSSAENIEVTDNVDIRLVVSSVSGTGWTCTTEQNFTCTRPGLAAAATATITVQYNAALTPAATVTNTASAKSDEAGPTPSNTASVYIAKRTTSTVVSCVPSNVLVNQATTCT